jgi:urease accessory protein
MLTLTQRRPADSHTHVHFILALTAEERTRSRHYFQTEEGYPLYLHLPRGTVLRQGDLLQSEAGDRLVRITAKPEPVMTVTASTPLDLLRAAYHLGNRHVLLEVSTTYLRLSPDPVLKTMLEQLGLHTHEEIAPFEPELGAYGHSHTHTSVQASKT